jgi:hypothetical protein
MDLADVGVKRPKCGLGRAEIEYLLRDLLGRRYRSLQRVFLKVIPKPINFEAQAR